jgi:hypothetical protein
MPSAILSKIIGNPKPNPSSNSSSNTNLNDHRVEGNIVLDPRDYEVLKIESVRVRVRSKSRLTTTPSPKPERTLSLDPHYIASHAI